MHLFPSRAHPFSEGILLGADNSKVRKILKSRRILIAWMALGLLLLVLAGIEQSAQQKPQAPQRAQHPLNTLA
jgi:hypothetical protein